MGSIRALRYWGAVIVGVTLVVSAAFWVLTDRFPWLELWRTDPAAAAQAPPTTQAPAEEPDPAPAPAAAATANVVTDTATAAAAGVAATVTEAAAVASPYGASCQPRPDRVLHRAAAKAATVDADTVTVTAHTTGPGLGHAARVTLGDAYRDCSGTRVRTLDLAGAPAAFRVTAPGAASTVFSYGDVVVTVTSVAAAQWGAIYGNTPDPGRHDTVVAAAVAAAARHIEPVCANVADDPTGAARNPYSGEFTGLVEHRTVTVADLGRDGAATTTTTSAVEAEIVVEDHREYRSAMFAASTLAELEVPPVARPRWRPEPDTPRPPPEQASYTARAPDPIGPGCGWSFTGTVAPVEDPDTLTAETAAARSAAIRSLRTERAEAAADAADADEDAASYDQYLADRAAWAAYDSAVQRLTPPPSTTTTTAVPPPTTTSTTAPPSTTVPGSTTTTSTTVPGSTTTSTTVPAD